MSSMARSLRPLTLFSVLLATTVLYFLFMRQPYSDRARQDEQWISLADGEVTSVGVLAYAESTERQLSVHDSS